MWRAAAILALTTMPIDWSTIAGSAVIVLVALYVLLLYFSPSRRKGMAVVASEVGLQFFPVLSADQIGTRGASFVYGGIAGARNCMRGIIKGRETVIFDQNMCDPVSGSGGPFEITVVGFRVAADSFCRDRGVIQRTFWHVEKMGEWVFVYHAQPPVTPAEIASYVEEARARFETATNPKA
jgi:hypothetical protein